MAASSAGATELVSGSTQLFIAGAVGKATTKTMVEAVLAANESQATIAQRSAPALIVLSDDADANGAPWQQLLESLGSTGVAVLSADLVPGVDRVRGADQIRSADNPGIAVPAGGPRTVVTFGLSSAAQFRVTDLDTTLAGTTFTLLHGEQEYLVRLQLLGEHQAYNAAAALALAHTLGLPLQPSIGALEKLPDVGSGRMLPLQRDDGLIVIDDTVSASVQSTSAALKTLALVARARRSVAILGALDCATEIDQHQSRDDHDRIGRLVVRLNIKKLVVVGQSARHIHNAAGLEGSWDGESIIVDTAARAYDLLGEELQPTDVVLVKSSKSAGLGSLAARLAGATQ